MGRVPPVVLERALDSSLRSGAVRLRRLVPHVMAIQNSRRAGLAVLTDLVGKRVGGGAPSASELERVLYELFDLPELEPFVRQPALPWSTMGERADGLVVPSRLLLEGDGRKWHEQLSDMTRDRRRDRQAVAHGLHPIRFTWTELTETGPAVRAEVLDIHRSVLAFSSAAEPAA